MFISQELVHVKVLTIVVQLILQLFWHINYCCCCFSGVFAGSIIRRFGITKTILTGTLLSSAGYIASSFTSNFYTLYVTYGALPGLGLVMISLSSLVTVGNHFDEHQALAMGICQSGGSVGGFIFNPLI